MEANEPPLDMRRTRLSLQCGVKLMSNEVNPAYSSVFQSDFVATYEAKESVIKPLGGVSMEWVSILMSSLHIR